MPSDVPLVLDRLLTTADVDAREEAWADLIATHSRLLLKVAAAGRGGYDSKMDRYAFILDGLRANDYRRLRTFDPTKAKLSTYLVVVGRRLCTDYERQRHGRFRGDAKRPRSQAERSTRRALADLTRALPVTEDTLAGSDDVDGPLDTIHRDTILADAIGNLVPEDRLLLQFRHEDEMSVAQIRELLAFPTVFHVYRRLRAVYAALRGALVTRGVRSAAE